MLEEIYEEFGLDSSDEPFSHFLSYEFPPFEVFRQLLYNFDLQIFLSTFY